MGLVINTCCCGSSFIEGAEVVLQRLLRSIISELRSKSGELELLLTNRGTQILMLSVLELQSSEQLELVVELLTELPQLELLDQLGPFSSRTHIFSPFINVIWLTT